MSSLKKVTVDEITINLNNLRVPLSAIERAKLDKIYRYYGAQSIVDYVDDYIFDGEYLLVAEDGENLKSQNTNVCNFVNGKFWVNNHAHILQAKNGNNLKYIYYLLNLINFRPYVTGSAQPKLTKENLSRIELRIHEPDTQQKIASVLSALDAKIELNNRINAELEAMAKTLYDYWFVQFDFPDADSKPYKSSGGKMVWNEVLKREVPVGWEIGSLLDIAEYANGIPCQKFRPTGNDYFRVIKIREMNEGFSQNSEFVRTDIPEKAKVENGDILFSWSASLDVKIWTGGKGALNQHIFKVTSREYPKSFYFHQLLNYLQHFKMMAENRKTTMGHITQEHLEQSRIVLPPKNLTFELEKKIAPLFSKKVNNEVENQTLTELRDWLLPMLMNGQVKASEL
jgi:type I restriction enzyme S subunit